MSVRALAVLLLAPVLAGAQAELRFSYVDGHDDVPLLAVQAGPADAPGVLLIHGLAFDHRAFLPQFESDLPSQFHLVAFDLRGHGGSGKPWRDDDYHNSDVWADDVAAVIKATKLKKPVIVAWSYGSFVAIDYLRHYGIDNVAGLNVVGITAGLVPPDPPADDPETRAMMASLIERRRQSLSPDLRDNAAAAATTIEFFRFPGMTALFADHSRTAQLLLPSYARRALLTRDLDNTDLVTRLDLPVLITAGSEDPVVSEALARALLAKLPNATLSIYDETGHLPFAQRAQRFNRELAEFVSKKARGAGRVP